MPGPALRARCLVAWSMAMVSVAGGGAASDRRLIDAVRQQDGDAVRALVAQHVDVNARQADGATALHWAAYRDDLALADLLIRAGADVNAANELGVVPLYLAAENASAAMVERLLTAGADPNAVLPSGETLLMTAARSGSASAVQALIARGADVHAREQMDGQTALMWAVSQQHPDVVRLLIAAGADVQAASRIRRQVVARGERLGGPQNIDWMEAGGFTPLLFAARVGDVASARLLLAAGADVNDTTPAGETALIVASHSGHRALAEWLLDMGADPNAARVGYTALHVAVLRGEADLVQALLAHGADPNARTTRGTVVGRDSKLYMINGHQLAGATPFFLAAKYADTKSMRLLAAAGADPHAGLEDGTTPLMVAAGMYARGLERAGQDRHGRQIDSGETDLALSQNEDLRGLLNSGIDAVQLAVELGADVNAANQAGDTALHSAARHGFETVIQFLVSQGARLDVKNNAGQTPLMVAESRRAAYDRTITTVTVDLLRKLGGEPMNR